MHACSKTVKIEDIANLYKVKFVFFFPEKLNFLNKTLNSFIKHLWKHCA